MENLHKDLVEKLSAILPTHYEMHLHSGLSTPCISYMETNNYLMSESQVSNQTIGYNRVTYQIKVWGDDIRLILDYAREIDGVLRPLGWKRIASGELYDFNSTMIQKIMTYECISLEKFE